MNHQDVIIIGAGASGMAAAICAAERGRNVLLLERGDRPGRKILASGNGRCNLMNSGKPRYYGETDFAEEVLRNCPYGEITAFFRRWGLMLADEEEGRVYPVTFQAATVLTVLRNAMKNKGVCLNVNNEVVSAAYDRGIFTVAAADGSRYTSDRLIVTCGGPAQPKLGGTEDGIAILRSFGHETVPVFPALVPLCTDRRSISGLSGIRVRCAVSLYGNNELLHQEEGEVLFTEYGISGICVMQCARFIRGRNTHLELNFLREIFRDEDEAVCEMKRRRGLYTALDPTALFTGVLNEKIAYAVMKQAGIPLRGETAGEITDEQIRRAASAAFRYHAEVEGSRGTDYAQVTAGGACCSGFDPHTMESLSVPGLYAAGEVLNVDGDCGGFNLMFAFASGILAGRNA